MRLPAHDLEQITDRLIPRAGHHLFRKSILITGGGGFVGRWLVESFSAFNAAAGLNARILVLTRTGARFRAAAPHLVADPAVTVVEGDLHALRRSTHACDLVIHGATESARTLATAHPALIADTIDGTREVLEFAVRCGARRFLYLSSGAVYGAPRPGPVPEEFAVAPDPLHPGAAYAETKRAGELLCAAYGRKAPLEVVIARGFAFLGPHLPLDRDFAAGNFLDDALHGRTIAVHSDGSPVRSYLYPTDLAVWLWLLLVEGVSLRAYNVGSERPVSIAELAREAARLTDPPREVAIHGTSDPAAATDWYVPTTARARTELGLEETVDWRAALRRTFDWYRERQRSEVPAGACP